MNQSAQVPLGKEMSEQQSRILFCIRAVLIINSTEAQ